MLAAGRDPDDLAVRLVALLDDPPDPESLRRSVAHLTWDASLDALEGVLDAVAVGDANRPPAEGESGKSLPAADGGR